MNQFDSAIFYTYIVQLNWELKGEDSTLPYPYEKKALNYVIKGSKLAYCLHNATSKACAHIVNRDRK